MSSSSFYCLIFFGFVFYQINKRFNQVRQNLFDAISELKVKNTEIQTTLDIKEKELKELKISLDMEKKRNEFVKEKIRSMLIAAHAKSDREAIGVLDRLMVEAGLK